MVFALTNQLDKTVARLNELENAIDAGHDLGQSIKVKGDMNPVELVELIIKNHAAVAARMVDQASFKKFIDSSNGISTEVKLLNDFKKLHTDELNEQKDKLVKNTDKQQDQVEKLEDLNREFDFIKQSYVNQNQMEAFEEELDKIRKTFLDNLKMAAGMTDTSRKMTQAFDKIVNRKNKREPDQLSTTDKGRFKQLMDKWDLMEER